jgi:hypothetical protein
LNTFASWDNTHPTPFSGPRIHALIPKFRLICSWELQKRLRQFDQIAPWIAEKSETQREPGRVLRFADNPHITASQFTDRRIDIFFSPSAIVRIRRKSSVPVYQAAAASKSGTRSPTWSPRHEVNGLVGLVDVASLDAGMGFFQKVRKRISQKNGPTCAFSPAIT